MPPHADVEFEVEVLCWGERDLTEGKGKASVIHNIYIYIYMCVCVIYNVCICMYVYIYIYILRTLNVNIDART